MKNCLPGELWNQVGVPTKDTAATLISTYLSEMAYKLSSITDIMMTKEFWHTVCEFANRCGAMRERVIGNITSAGLSLTVAAPTFGSFQRFVGAGVDNVAVGLDKIETSETSGGNIITFSSTLTPVVGASYSAYADISVVPDFNAVPSNQKAPLWFLKKYERALLSGTLMRLYAMANEKWMDEAAARMHATTYLHEVNRVTHGLITGGMRREIIVDAESVLARMTSTTSTTSNSSTVG